MQMQNIESRNRQGIIYIVICYLLWGILAIYWKLMADIPAHLILTGRMIFSFIFVGVLLLFQPKYRNSLKISLGDKKKLALLLCSSLLISINWYTYIWGVNHNKVVEASLGYYINPLLSMFFGIVLLKEKYDKTKIASFLLALAGVTNMVLRFGTVPWIALILAMTFGLYGLLKKIVGVNALVGLFLETMFIVPFALGYLGISKSAQVIIAHLSPAQLLLLALSGPITAVPLLVFAKGVQMISMTSLGFLQYITPTLTLCCGIFLFRESFTFAHLITFAFIWSGILLFFTMEIRRDPV